MTSSTLEPRPFTQSWLHDAVTVAGDAGGDGLQLPAAQRICCTALIWLVAAVGCHFSADYGTSYRCIDTGPCPAGYHCTANVCTLDSELPPGDAMPGTPDAGGTPAEPGCGTTDNLYDSFESSELDSDRWRIFNPGSSSLAITTGAGVLDFQIATGANTASNGIISQRRYFLDRSQIAVEVVGLDPGRDIELELKIEVDAGNRYFISARAGFIRFGYRYNGTDVVGNTMTYQPQVYRFWRIRDSGGTVYWQTSPDNVEWITRYDSSNWWPTGSAEIILSATAFNRSQPASIRVDDLNGGVATGMPSWCPSEQLVDRFDAGSVDVKLWELYQIGSCALVQQAGWLSVSWGAGTGACTVHSQMLYDLRESSIVTEVTQPASGDAKMFMIAVSARGPALQFRQSRTTLYAQDGLTVINASPHMPILHRWWRIREAGGTVHWETSSDARTWAPFATLLQPPGLDAVQIRLGSEVLVGTAEGTNSGFGRLNSIQ